jgi:pre-mRNA-processing factor 19
VRGARSSPPPFPLLGAPPPSPAAPRHLSHLARRAKLSCAGWWWRTGHARYKATATHPLHTTTKPGIKCLAVDPKEPSTLVTGGQDGGVIVFDKESGKIAKTIKAHSKPVTSITVHPTAPALFSTSVDKTVKVWTGSAADGFDKGVTIKPHKGEVSGLSLHPTGSYFASASKDGTWAFTDIGDGGKAQTLLTSTDEGKSLGGYTAISFHPDGLLCGVTSASGTVQIYDVRKEEVVATLTVRRRTRTTGRSLAG